MKFIDVPELINAHPFIRVGMRIVEDRYREHQFSFREAGPYADVTMATDEGWKAALEVLQTQMVELFTLDRDDVYAHLRGHIRSRCGTEGNPRLLEEWNRSEHHATLT